MNYTYNSETLYHHGILGQKWGIRRFQNSDGSYTEEGKKRRRDDFKETISNVKKNVTEGYSNNRETINKVAKIAAVAALTGLSAYALYTNKTAAIALVKKAGPKIVSGLSASASRVGKAMTDAMLASVGGIAISKLAEKLPTDDSVDESTRNRNKIVLETASAGIKEAIKTTGSSNNNSNSGGNIGKDVSDKLGAPSNKGVDRQSNEYQNLFKDSSGNQRDASTRSVIKSLASAGYDIDQLKAYVRGIDDGTIKHSVIDVGYYAILSLANI